MNIRLLQSVALVLMATALSGCSPSSMDEQGANRLITNALGLAEQGDYAAARDSVFSALDIYHRLGQEIHSADAERILGGFDEANGAFDSALTHYALALQHYRGQAERESARAMIMSIVNVHLEMGDVKGAFAQCEEALRLAGVVGDREGMLKYSRALLPILRALGRTDDYNSLWKELMDAADSSGNAAARIDLRDEAGINALSKEDAAQAVKLFSEALQETEHGGDSLTSIRVRLHLAQAFDAAGNLPEAMTTYTVALKESDGFSNGRSIREAILFHVGNTLLRLHRLEDARRFYEAAVASSTERNDVQAKMYALLQVAQCELQRHPDSSRVLAQSALNLLQNGSPPAMSSYAYGTLGLANLKLGNPVEALNDFRQAIESTELIVAHRGEDNLYVECERAAVGSGLVPWHDEAIDLLLRLGRRDEALEYALRKNHALLLADLGSMDLSTSHDDLDRLLSQWHAVRTRLVGEVGTGAGHPVPARGSCAEYLEPPPKGSDRCTRDQCGNDRRSAGVETICGNSDGRSRELPAAIARGKCAALVWHNFPPPLCLYRFARSNQRTSCCHRSPGAGKSVRCIRGKSRNAGHGDRFPGDDQEGEDRPENGGRQRIALRSLHPSRGARADWVTDRADCSSGTNTLHSHPCSSQRAPSGDLADRTMAGCLCHSLSPYRRYGSGSGSERYCGIRQSRAHRKRC